MIGDVTVRVQWHHGVNVVTCANLTDDGLLDTDELAARLALPPLVRAIDVQTTDDPWQLLVIDLDTDDTLGVVTVAAGAGA